MLQPLSFYRLQEQQGGQSTLPLVGRTGISLSQPASLLAGAAFRLPRALHSLASESRHDSAHTKLPWPILS
jgi:hypothetical protein